jgi:biofilm PGA synthesis N-glycosyltransferase PgaC
MKPNFTFVSNENPGKSIELQDMTGTIDLGNALFYVLILVAIIQISIYWLVYRKFSFYVAPEKKQDKKPLSVIICARNEAIRIKKNLPSILEQDYPAFEVIVVNDCSWDETGDVLDDLAKQYSKLKIVTIKEQEKYKHGKKFALTLGIKAAANEYLVLTDADCAPAGSNWLTKIQSNFLPGKEIVLGYGAYSKETGILNKCIRFDALFIAIQYISAALRGNAYMGVGRNLAYTKSLFFRSKGFAKHNHILSGDDDLFVNENATLTNTTIECDIDAITYSEAKKTFSDWFSQKKRHMTTGKFYKTSHLFLLSLQSGSAFLFYTLLIALLILRFEWRILLSLYILSVLIRLPIIYKASIKLNEKDLVWAFPFLDIIHSLLQPLFFTANLITKQKTWK